ncbi:MAG: phosphoglycerate kinase, partial [Acidimicrobiia bacterium]
MTRYLTLDEVDVAGLEVLVRSDLNVPIEDGVVGDDFRLQAALPTLELLVDREAKVTVISHLGRPKGFDPALSLQLVAQRLDELSTADVAFESPGEITVLENTRFDPGETTNSPDTAHSMAQGYDLFVQDAFGSVHRAHASTTGIPELVRSVAGPLLVEELTALTRFLGDPDRPYTVVLGGAKVSDKLAVIKNLLPRVDEMLVGGGMCFTFLKALGGEVGDSLLEGSMLQTVSELLASPDGPKISLPLDIVAARAFAADSPIQTVPAGEIPSGWMGLDIGPATAAEFGSLISTSATTF